MTRREAAPSDYRFSALVLAIVKSDPFQMRIRKGREEAREFITKSISPGGPFYAARGVLNKLPFLDSMVGAQTLLKNSAASPKTRLGCIYVPHGATMDKWTPAGEGRGFTFSEALSPLEKYRDRTTVVSNLVHASATGADAGAEHARSAAIYLSGGRPQKKRRSRVSNDDGIRRRPSTSARKPRCPRSSLASKK